MNEEIANIADHQDKIDPKRAGEIVQEFFNYYEIDLDDLDDDSQAQMLKAQKRLIKSVRLGRLEFNLVPSKKTGLDEMIITQHLKRPFANGIAVIHYGEIGGRAKVAMKGAVENDTAGKMQCLMGALAGMSRGIMSDLTGPDYSLMESLSAIFLLL